MNAWEAQKYAWILKSVRIVVDPVTIKKCPVYRAFGLKGFRRNERLKYGSF